MSELDRTKLQHIINEQIYSKVNIRESNVRDGWVRHTDGYYYYCAKEALIDDITSKSYLRLKSINTSSVGTTISFVDTNIIVPVEYFKSWNLSIEIIVSFEAIQDVIVDLEGNRIENTIENARQAFYNHLFVWRLLNIPSSEKIELNSTIIIPKAEVSYYINSQPIKHEIQVSIIQLTELQYDIWGWGMGAIYPREAGKYIFAVIYSVSGLDPELVATFKYMLEFEVIDTSYPAITFPYIWITPLTLKWEPDSNQSMKIKIPQICAEDNEMVIPTTIVVQGPDGNRVEVISETYEYTYFYATSIGRYTVTYTAEDTGGNVTTFTHVVNIISEQ